VSVFLLNCANSAKLIFRRIQPNNVEIMCGRLSLLIIHVTCYPPRTLNPLRERGNPRSFPDFSISTYKKSFIIRSLFTLYSAV